MELKDYLRIARQRWMAIMVITLLAIGAATVLTLRATPQYSSSARLFISTSQSDTDQAYQGGLFSQQRVKSYANLLTGEEISKRVVDELNISRTPRQLSSQISAAAQPDTVVLSITTTDADPKLARLIAQTTSEVFVKYVKELETPDGKSTAPVKASIVDGATEPGGPVSPTLSATWPWRQSSACCSALVSQCFATRSTRRSRRPMRSTRPQATHPCWAASTSTRTPRSIRSSPPTTRFSPRA